MKPCPRCMAIVLVFSSTAEYVISLAFIFYQRSNCGPPLLDRQLPLCVCVCVCYHGMIRVKNESGSHVIFGIDSFLLIINRILHV